MSDYAEELIMLADILDSRGLSDVADDIDSIIKESSDIHDIIQRRVEQESPQNYPSPRVQRFVYDLNSALESMVGPDSVITYDVKETVMSIVQKLLKDNVKSYMLPSASRSGLSTLYKAKNDVIGLVDSIIELEDELESKGLYQGQEIEESEYKDSFDNLQKLYQMVRKIKNGGRPKDPKTYDLIRNYYNERRGREVW